MHTPSAILCVTSESKLFTCHSLQLHICRLSHALVSSRYFVSYLYKNKVGPHRRTHLDRIRWSLSISVSLASGTRCLLLLHLPCSNQICTFLCFIVKTNCFDFLWLDLDHDTNRLFTAFRRFLRWQFNQDRGVFRWSIGVWIHAMLCQVSSLFAD